MKIYNKRTFNQGLFLFIMGLGGIIFSLINKELKFLILSILLSVLGGFMIKTGVQNKK